MALSSIRQALDAERLLLEVEGDLLVINMTQVAHVRIHPAPEALPKGVITGARIIG